jgi:hypothetical protein
MNNFDLFTNNKSSVLHTVDSTSGSAVYASYYSGLKMTENPRKVIPTISNEIVMKNAIQLIKIIEGVTLKIAGEGKDISSLPLIKSIQ